MTSENLTPCKATLGRGCFVCSTEVGNVKYRTKTVGRTQDLLENVCDILGVAKEQVPCNKYLCRSCLRQVNKCAKLQQEIEDCKNHLKKVYLSENERFKRCLPTDVETSPNNAPLKKSAKHSTKVQPKKLIFPMNELPKEQTSYQEIHCNIATNATTDNIQPSGVPNQRASELSGTISFGRNDLPGAIYEVQVIKHLIKVYLHVTP